MKHMESNPARNMKGKGAPKSDVFGVIGDTKEDSFSKTLGGLVKDTATGKPKPGTLMKGKMMTERDIMGNSSKTKVPGAHYAQVPYAGRFLVTVGSML